MNVLKTSTTKDNTNTAKEKKIYVKPIIEEEENYETYAILACLRVNCADHSFSA